MIRYLAQLQNYMLRDTGARHTGSTRIQTTKATAMAASQNPHTARWFAKLFHECSQSLAHWEARAEAQLAECHEFEHAIQALQTQKKDIAVEKAVYDQKLAELGTVLRALATKGETLGTQGDDQRRRAHTTNSPADTLAVKQRH